MVKLYSVISEYLGKNNRAVTVWCRVMYICIRKQDLIGAEPLSEQTPAYS